MFLSGAKNDLDRRVEIEPRDLFLDPSLLRQVDCYTRRVCCFAVGERIIVVGVGRRKLGRPTRASPGFES